MLFKKKKNYYNHHNIILFSHLQYLLPTKNKVRPVDFTCTAASIFFTYVGNPNLVMGLGYPGKVVLPFTPQYCLPECERPHAQLHLLKPFYTPLKDSVGNETLPLKRKLMSLPLNS